VKALAATVIVLLAAGGEASAHQLDEYLQAARVSIARDRLALDLDLTPGISVASSVIATLDSNADGSLAPAEAEAYGRRVLSDLLVTLDGNRVGMTLLLIEVPTIEEMRHGLGTIRMQVAGSVEARPGRHQVQFFNNHRPETSVYMVNALVPEDRGVDVVSQSRDARQRVFQMEATVRPQWLWWWGSNRR
jgi:hypothetical protein